MANAWDNEPSLDTCKDDPPLGGSLKVIFWPVLNGWFGKYILCAGTDTDSVVSPTDTFTDANIPVVVAIPTDCLGLK